MDSSMNFNTDKYKAVHLSRKHTRDINYDTKIYSKLLVKL